MTQVLAEPIPCSPTGSPGALTWEAASAASDAVFPFRMWAVDGEYLVDWWTPGQPLPDNATAVAFDSETRPVVSGSPVDPAIGQACFNSSRRVFLIRAEHIRAFIEETDLKYPEIIWIEFNAPFDCGVAGWPDTPLWRALHEGRLVDLEIRGTLYSLDDGTYMDKMSLDYLAKWKLGIEVPKDPAIRLSFFPGMTLSEKQTVYAATDPVVTLRCWEKMPQYYPTEDINLRAYFALTHMGRTGMRRDVERASQLDVKYTAEQMKQFNILDIYGIAPANPSVEGSVAVPGVNKRKQQLLEALEAQYGVKLPRAKKTGVIATSTKTLDLALITREIAKPVWLVAARAFDHARKMRSTYLNPEHVGTDGRVHSRFSPMVKTGRTASSGPPMQNVPDEVRNCYIPSPMHLYMASDYNQLEMCGLAQSCYKRFGFSVLRDLINAGLDAHYWFGDIISRKSGGPSLEGADEDVVDAFRRRAKATNFGFPGGLGAATFVAYARNYGVEITLEQAKELKALWLDSFPEMKLHLSPEIDEYWTSRQIHIFLSQNKLNAPHVRTIDQLESFLLDSGWEKDDVFRATSSVSAYICRLQTGRVKRNCTYCAATNMEFQGLCADGAKRALWAGYMEGWRMVDFIHDEILQEIPLVWTPEQLTAHAAHVNEVMCREMSVVIPDVRIKVETAIMDRWYKKAKPLHDANGNLIVWTPELAERLKKEKEAKKKVATAA